MCLLTSDFPNQHRTSRGGNMRGPFSVEAMHRTLKLSFPIALSMAANFLLSLASPATWQVDARPGSGSPRQGV